MNDLLLRIQDAMLQLEGGMLWLPSVLSVILGLFLWLGGSRFSSLVIGILGALVGAACGVGIGRWLEVELIVSTAIGGAVFAIVAVLLERIVIVILGAGIFAVVFGSAYMGITMDDLNFPETPESDRPELYNSISHIETRQTETRPGYSGEGDVTPGTQAYDQAAIQADNEANAEGMGKLRAIFSQIRQSTSGNRTLLVVWTVIGAVLGLGLAYVLTRIMMAICCSIVGSAATIGGILVLMLAKDVEVLSMLLDKPKLMPTIFALMIVMGCVSQLILSRAKAASETELDEDE
ncbi:MAG: hypothetical protein IID32_00735 [Planctomycetes bacterium]|nr:hypothetical protein [Planctomycetota bacterium]